MVKDLLEQVKPALHLLGVPGLQLDPLLPSPDDTILLTWNKQFLVFLIVISDSWLHKAPLILPRTLTSSVL